MGNISKTGLNWIAFFSLIAVSWVALIISVIYDNSAILISPGFLGALDPYFDAQMWRSICISSVSEHSFSTLFLMWGLMSVAMMAPTAVPMISSYFALIQNSSHDTSVYCFPLLVLGYLVVWFVYSIVAASLQMYLTELGILSTHGLSLSEWLTAGLLLVAGLYQFTNLKEACLSKCRSPLSFFMSHWKPGPTGAFQMGLWHGMVCVGCCWALMALGFVGGMMNLVWMVGAMALMIVEKIPELGRLVTKPLGYGLLASSFLVLVRGTLS